MKPGDILTGQKGVVEGCYYSFYVIIKSTPDDSFSNYVEGQISESWPDRDQKKTHKSCWRSFLGFVRALLSPVLAGHGTVVH